MQFVTIIPFNCVEDVPRYAKQHNIKKYNIMVIPERGVNYPKKFLLITEDIEKNDYPFMGQYFPSLEETLNNLYIKTHNYKDIQNPYIYWQLINGNYILFSACIDYPFNIYKNL